MNKEKATRRKSAKQALEEIPRTERSEYDQVFNSLIKLKHDKNADFADKVASAMKATDSLFEMSRERGEATGVKSTCKLTDAQSKHVNATHLDNHDKGDKALPCKPKTSIRDPIKTKDNANELFDIIDKFANNGKESGNNIVEALLEALKGNKTMTTSQVVPDELQSEAHEGQAVQLLQSLEQCINKEQSHHTPPEESEKGKKLVSGRSAKPDETDIQKVVKYAHEKLDAKHVRNRKLDNLSFNILIAGELELACLPNITDVERRARTQIAKTLCYHKNYLGDTDLRDGYEEVLKQVEFGKRDWTDNLEDELHSLLDYRANILAREKLTQQPEGFTKVESRKDRRGASDSATGRIVYCMEYNGGNCPQTDHHEGRFSNRKVTKFHICRKCYKEGEYKSHRATDECCPRKDS